MSRKSPSSHSKFRNVQIAIKKKFIGGKSCGIDMIMHEIIKRRIEIDNEFRQDKLWKYKKTDGGDL